MRKKQGATGFQKLTPEQRIDIARKGGQTAHREGRAHQFTQAEAREAAKKSVLARAKRKP